ncbi:PiggyBac transposable element-derived protein 4-like [Elysia marginata]|uniref:PiggyBac transposable element-derived protein 4-like n=1 Tax=Elysia marginata TaxID=1093978 RepID=A0AAV4HQN4_9GAST|nr:PiggyBac transposable element-derived protein 4-like [Elysia marginata]
MIQISIINSFILMKRARPGDGRTSVAGNHLRFRTKLAKSLLTATESMTPQRPATVPDTPSVRGTCNPYSPSHMLSRMPGRKRPCYQCAQNGDKMPSGRTRETVYGCKLCNVHLHHGHCYSKYHENLK